MFAAGIRAGVLRRRQHQRLTPRPTINLIDRFLLPSRPLHHRFVSTSAATDPSLPARPSFLRRAANVFALGIVFTTLGIAMTAAPAVQSANELLSPPTDAETLEQFVPETDHQREVDNYINTHPLTQTLRAKSEFSESRPHLKIPAAYRGYNLTGGTLLGPGRIVVPPLIFAERAGKSLVSLLYLGDELCGHPGIVHGGLLATILDEGLGRCCFAALPQKIGLTANLNVNYRAPAPAGSYVVLKAATTRVEGRKAWVEGRLETLVAEGETPTVLAEATALFVMPKHAALMTNVYPTT